VLLLLLLLLLLLYEPLCLMLFGILLKQLLCFSYLCVHLLAISSSCSSGSTQWCTFLVLLLLLLLGMLVLLMLLLLLLLLLLQPPCLELFGFLLKQLLCFHEVCTLLLTLPSNYMLQLAEL
jgi:hypothetical protein